MVINAIAKVSLVCLFLALLLSSATAQTLPTTVAAITNDGGKLFFKIDGQPKLELFPETETDFFMKAVDAQVTFVKDESGKVIRLRFKQGSGSGIPAPKIK